MHLQAAFVCLHTLLLHLNTQTAHSIAVVFPPFSLLHLPSMWSNMPQTIIMQAVYFLSDGFDITLIHHRLMPNTL